MFTCGFSYSQEDVSKKDFEEKLKQIELHIGEKQYNEALDKLKQIESISNDNNRFEIEFLKAKIFYRIKGEQEKAINLLLKGLDELELKPELLNVRIKYAAYLGEIFNEAKNFDKSKFYYQKSLKDGLKLKDTLAIIDNYWHISEIFYNKNNQDSSKHYLKMIIKTPINNVTEKIISKSYNSLGVIARENDNLDLAQKYGRISLKIKEDRKDTVGMAIALVNLGNILYKKNDFIKVKENYLKAYKFIRTIKSKQAINVKENVLYNLAYANEQLKDYEKAYHYLEKATDLTDSLTEASINQNISEIEAKYNVAKEAEKTTAEKNKRLRAQVFFYGSLVTFVIVMVISYIFYRNYRLRQSNKFEQLENEMHTKIINATIDAKEKERKSIAETLHDNVSALLSSANLHLQATKAQLRKDAPKEITKAQTIVNEASVKIRDLSHELISSVLLKFGLAFAVHDMCQKYSNSEITLISDDNGVKRYDQDFEIKIHNIIEELINNILKHSKASNATIMLIHRKDDMLGIRINDDGIGFDVKKAKQKDGLGLSHINARIKIMKGVFTIETSKDNGTSIFMLVPIKFREEVA